MVNAILGIKKEMHQEFLADGSRVPVSVVVSGDSVVTQIKTLDKDGYWGVQVGFGQRKIKNITKPLIGHLRGAMGAEKQKTPVVERSRLGGTAEKWAPRFLREVRLDDLSDVEGLSVGDVVGISDVIKEGDSVEVSGVSKGKGFAGVVKRWKFAGGPKTHGQSDRLRAPGSIGQGTTPGRVYKGKKMAGRMGGNGVTVKGLKVLGVNQETGEIRLSGPIPGPKGKLVVIKKVERRVENEEESRTGG